ncbi:MAG: dephospho-CoA kinase [Candidatus Micrarchaeota archaeon]|nr:dephospho-CoA kinase [Candidatus Micrarchaeota archaeon]
MIVAITGMPGSGKSTAAEILKKKGFKVVELSDFIKKEMRHRGIEITAKNIEHFAIAMRKKLGMDMTAKFAIKDISRMRGDIAISGVRDIDEVLYMRRKLKKIIPVIALVAPQRLRYERIKARARPSDVKSFKEFRWRDNENKKLGIGRVIHSADMLVSNSGTRRQLSDNMGRALSMLREKHALS